MGLVSGCSFSVAHDGRNPPRREISLEILVKGKRDPSFYMESRVRTVEADQMAKVIAFDLHGTLTVMSVDWDFACSIVSERIGKRVENRKNLRALLTETWGTDTYERVYSAVKRIELEAIRTAKIFPEVKSTLEKLSSNFKLFLLSLLSEEAVETLQDKFDIKKFFTQTITRRDAPNRMMQLKLMGERFNLKPEDILVIDDDVNNLKTMKKGGYEVILIDRKDVSPDPELENIRSLKDLISILANDKVSLVSL